MNFLKIKNLYLISAIAVFLSSCVPARQVEELKEKYSKCEEERRYLGGQRQDLETENTELKAELNNLKSKIKSLETDTMVVGTSLRKMIRQYDKINKLNDELLARQSELRKGSEDESRKLQSSLQDLQENLLIKEDELKALEKDLDKKSDDLEVLNKELQIRESRVKELEDLIAQKDGKVNELKEKISKALLGFQDKGLTVEQKGGRIYVSMEAQLLFPKGSTAIDKEGKKALSELAKALEGQEDIHILVEGHTDIDPISGSGALKDNWDLSVLRATAVVRILMENKKMNPSQLTAAGRGEFMPVDPAEDEKAKAKNRRIEVILTPNLNKLFEILEKEG